MTLYTLENPVFQLYLCVVALTVLKMMYYSLVSPFRMIATGTGMRSPEDLQPGLLNPNPKFNQFSAGDYVDRPRRILQSDVELQPPFWVAGLAFIGTDPSTQVATSLFLGFLASQAGYLWAYERAMGLGYRMAFFLPSVIIIITMAATVLTKVLWSSDASEARLHSRHPDRTLTSQFDEAAATHPPHLAATAASPSRD